MTPTPWLTLSKASDLENEKKTFLHSYQNTCSPCAAVAAWCCHWWKPPLGGFTGGRLKGKEQREDALTVCVCVCVCLKAVLPWKPWGQVQSLPKATDACSGWDDGEKVNLSLSLSVISASALRQGWVEASCTGSCISGMCPLCHRLGPYWVAGTASSPGLPLH